jgi:hypothetical protein
MTIAAQNPQTDNRTADRIGHRIAGRLARNLVVTLAVTAIFAFKAMDPGGHAIDPEMMTLASSR